jgi:hypothetical protein
MIRTILIALRAAVLATAVFWVCTYLVERIGWRAPYGMTQPAIFLVVFFLGVLMFEKK